MAGPCVHYTAAKEVKRRLAEFNIPFDSGSLVSNILPDLEVSHAYNYKTESGKLYNLIQKSVDYLKTNPTDDNTIRFLCHYLVDGLTVGQLHEDFWVKKWGVCKDDLMDFLGEFVINKTKQSNWPIIKESTEELISFYLEYSENTVSYFYDDAIIGDYKNFITEMTRRAVNIASCITASIILQVRK